MPDCPWGTPGCSPTNPLFCFECQVRIKKVLSEKVSVISVACQFRGTRCTWPGEEPVSPSNLSSSCFPSLPIASFAFPFNPIGFSFSREKDHCSRLLGLLAIRQGGFGNFRMPNGWFFWGGGGGNLPVLVLFSNYTLNCTGYCRRGLGEIGSVGHRLSSIGTRLADVCSGD